MFTSGTRTVSSTGDGGGSGGGLAGGGSLGNGAHRTTRASSSVSPHTAPLTVSEGSVERVDIDGKTDASVFRRTQVSGIGSSKP